ncbi:hypothetical protein GCM10022219_07570 [Microbacterium oryzae]|uniref:hypothetical protein n=1 Tax=Microbacterium oryzae TaxID=743009 RepID=UPI0015649ACA|nr:hypothetical protein [Microbacterium oryzae]
MSNPFPAQFPLPGDRSDDDLPTTETDGETVLDPDANDDLVDSADADRLAAGDDDDEI